MLFKSSNHPPKGTTLVETLIFTAIGSMLMVAVSSIYISALNTRSLVDSQQKIIYVDSFIRASIESEFLSSHQITSPVTGSSTVLSFFSEISGNDVAYSLSGSDLQEILGVSEPIVLNSLGVRVTDFSVVRLVGSPAAVRIHIEFEADSVRGRVINYSDDYTLTTRYE